MNSITTISTAKFYRQLRYAPTRKDLRNPVNRAELIFYVDKVPFSHFHLEKILLALKATKVTEVNYVLKDRRLFITSDEYTFEYILKEKKKATHERKNKTVRH